MDDFKDIIEEIKARNDISDIISSYIQLKPSGRNYKGLCPFHGEKTPSFHVNTSKQIYKCFGCGAGGDVISFIMDIENLDFMDALKFLAEKSGISINQNIDEKTRKKLEKIKKFQEINIEAARFFYSQLMKRDNDAFKYLIKRGLDEKIIKNFGLGYAPDAWDQLKNHLLSKKYTIEEIFECGLVSQNKNQTNYYDKFRNRVMFPIFDYKGNVIGFGGRVMDDSLPKYLNSPDSELFNKRMNLYGLNFARKHIGNDDKLILVEGYMDLISLYQFGIKNVVATLGTALTEDQAKLIKRYANNLILSYDSDQAGINASLRAIEILENAGLNARILNLGEYKDPDEYIRSKGVGNALSAIDSAVDSLQFKIDVLSKNYDLDDRKESMKFLQEAVKIIREIKSPVELNYYIEYLSKITYTNPDIIMSEFDKKTNSKINYNNKKVNTFKEKEVINIKKVSLAQDAQLYREINLIKFIMLSSKARAIVPLKIREEDFIYETSRIIYKTVLNTDIKGIIDINKIYNEKMDKDYLKKLDTISFSIDCNDINEIENIVNQFQKYTSKSKIEKLLEKQKRLEDRRKTIKEKTEEAKEVDLEIMKIALDIISENKKLKSL
ncbi:DNA primase [Peptostreptococcus equinus]|uniref:DNA primase n=1 Tax=Peptostreptococcus equinus TaxID=3003601 RepID=A0ABY7JL02_9FIRM|nr:DNA primase [Peptostreptococcus sp. CBA3647]WAW13992.1 DNA primase [Peptostreptococcus sp. CBA3647]